MAGADDPQIAKHTLAFNLELEGVGSLSELDSTLGEGNVAITLSTREFIRDNKSASLCASLRKLSTAITTSLINDAVPIITRFSERVVIV